MALLKKVQLITFLLILAGGILSAQTYSESDDFSYALKLYNEGFYDPAAQQFSKFINRYPGSERMADARFYYGESLIKINAYEDARIEFQDLAVSFPNHNRAPQGWMKVGECYELLGKKEEAAKAYETVKLLYAQNAFAPKGLLRSADLRMNIDQVERAEQLLREFLDRYLESADYPRGRVLYGKLLIKKLEYERAGEEFRSVAGLTEDREILAEARLGEAEVLQQLGLSSRAVTTLNDIISGNPGSSAGFSAVLALAGVHQDNREWEKAIAALRQASAAYTNADQRAAIDLALSQSFFLQGDYGSARSLLNQLVNNADVKIAFRAGFYLACCDFQEKRFDEAEAAFQSLLKQAADTYVEPEYTAAININLTRSYLEKGNFVQARSSLNRYREMNPEDPLLESLHKDLVLLAFRKNALSGGLDELQQFRGKFPSSIHRDDLTFAAGKAFFEDRQYQRSLLFFEQVADEYICSDQWDSCRTYIDFVNTYHQSAGQTGVNELARLMGKMLTGESREKMLFELGRIYLQDLKDYEAAAGIFEKYAADAADSSASGEGLYFLAESYLRSAEYKAFHKEDNNADRQKATSTLKQAMVYVNHAPNPDTLTYRFLTYTVPGSAEQDKAVQFWQHFEQKYPRSRLQPAVQYHLAEQYQAAGDTANAILYLDRVIANGSDKLIAGKAYWVKAEILQDQGQRDAAIQVLKDFLLAFDPHPYQAKAYWQLALMHAETGEYNLAAQFMERLLEQFNYATYAGEAPGMITDFYIRNSEYGKALAYVEPRIAQFQVANDRVARHFLALPPSEFYFYTGKAYYLQDDFHRARQSLLRYLTLSQNPAYQAESLLLMGRMAAEEEDYESALLHFALVKEDAADSYYQATEVAADIHFLQGEYADAQKKYDILLGLESSADKTVVFAGQRARCMVQQGLTTAAENEAVALKANYKSHPQLDNQLAAIEYEKASVAFSRKRFDSAINTCKNIMKKYKNTEFADDAQYLTGRAYTLLNKAEDALKEFDKLLKNYPESDLITNVYLTISQIYFRTDQTQEALSALQLAVNSARTPQASKVAMSELISGQKKMGIWDGVLKNAREYAQKYPNANDVLDKKVTIGNALVRLNRFNDAIEYLKKLKLAVNSEMEPEIQFYIGEAFFNSGQYDDAINEFLKIPLLSPKTKLPWEATAFYWAGQSYEKLGRTTDARRMYQEIVDRPGIERELKLEARRLIDKLNNMN